MHLIYSVGTHTHITAHSSVYSMWTYSIDFRLVVPDVDVGVEQCLIDGDTLGRVNLEHLGEDIASMLSWWRGEGVRGGGGGEGRRGEGGGVV